MICACSTVSGLTLFYLLYKFKYGSHGKLTKFSWAISSLVWIIFYVIKIWRNDVILGLTIIILSTACTDILYVIIFNLFRKEVFLEFRFRYFNYFVWKAYGKQVIIVWFTRTILIKWLQFGHNINTAYTPL